jgi:thiol peroxidase
MVVGTTLCMTLGMIGCGSTGGTSFLYKNITVADGSTMAGEGHTVLFKGSPQASLGNRH